MVLLAFPSFFCLIILIITISFNFFHFEDSRRMSSILVAWRMFKCSDGDSSFLPFSPSYFVANFFHCHSSYEWLQFWPGKCFDTFSKPLFGFFVSFRDICSQFWPFPWIAVELSQTLQIHNPFWFFLAIMSLILDLCHFGINGPNPGHLPKIFVYLWKIKDFWCLNYQISPLVFENFDFGSESYQCP